MTFIKIQNGDSRQLGPLVFLPGWGFDGLVARYGSWPQGVEVLAPINFCQPGLVADLKEYLVKNGITKIALVGWSMGANLAWQFAGAYPEYVSTLTLLAGRSCWPVSEVAAIKAELGDDVSKSMQGFYRKCFLGHKGLYRQFTEELEGDYLVRLQHQYLVDALDFLASFPLQGQVPPGVAVQVLHGRKDVIAPADEMPQIDGAVEQVIDTGSHLLFAHPRSYLL